MGPDRFLIPAAARNEALQGCPVRVVSEGGDPATACGVIDRPVVEVLQVDSETSRHHAETVAELRQAGTPVPTNDIWIAASAARDGTTVLTCDDHLQRIGRVGAVVIGRGC